VEFIQGSVCDRDLLARLFDQYRFRVAYHLAAYAAEGLSHFIRRFNYDNNVIGSINLINESLRHETECFVFASSIAAYGAIAPPMREDDRPLPEDPYGIAKLAVELDLAAAHKHFGLRYVIFRPHNVYGEYQNLGDPYRNVIGIFMNQIMQNRPMTIFGDGSQRRAFSYVKDITPAIAQSPWIEAAQCQVFNIGSDDPVTVNDLARHIARAMEVPNHTPELEPIELTNTRLKKIAESISLCAYGLGVIVMCAVPGGFKHRITVRRQALQTSRPD
jgi:UDP-glucose 4-epimerase